MGKAIFIAALGLIGFGVWSFFMFWLGCIATDHNYKNDGLVGMRGKELLQRAARIMGDIGISPSIDDPEIVRPVTRTAIDKWINDYHKENKAT